MKKFFLLAAMVGVALTGCMKNEAYVPKCETPISFEVANYVAQTRANGAFSTTETAEPRTNPISKIRRRNPP